MNNSYPLPAVSAPHPRDIRLALIVAGAVLGSSAFAATTTRNIQVLSGVATVQISVQPDAGVHAYCLEDQLPTNVAGRSISDGGTFDVFSGKVKWGPFLDDQPRYFTYQLVTTDTGTAVLSGSASFDGTTTAGITGDTDAPVTAGGLDSWLLRELGADVFSRPESQPGNNEDGDPFPIAVEYYFGLNPRLPDLNPVRMLPGGGTGNVTLRFIRLEGVIGVTLRLQETSDFIKWSALEGDPDQPIIVSLGNGYEQVDYQLPAVQGARFVKAAVEWSPP